jgi:hypothetical protein
MFYKVCYEGIFDEHYMNRLSILSSASIKFKIEFLETAWDVNDIENDEKIQTLAQIKVKKSDLYRAENLLADLRYSHYDEEFFNAYKVYEKEKERIEKRNGRIQSSKFQVLVLLVLVNSSSENERYGFVISLLILFYSIYLIISNLRAIKVCTGWIDRIVPIFFLISAFISTCISIYWLTKIIIV